MAELGQPTTSEPRASEAASDTGPEPSSDSAAVEAARPNPRATEPSDVAAALRAVRAQLAGSRGPTAHDAAVPSKTQVDPGGDHQTDVSTYHSTDKPANRPTDVVAPGRPDRPAAQQSPEPGDAGVTGNHSASDRLSTPATDATAGTDSAAGTEPGTTADPAAAADPTAGPGRLPGPDGLPAPSPLSGRARVRADSTGEADSTGQADPTTRPDTVSGAEPTGLSGLTGGLTAAEELAAATAQADGRGWTRRATSADVRVAPTSWRRDWWRRRD